MKWFSRRSAGADPAPSAATWATPLGADNVALVVRLIRERLGSAAPDAAEFYAPAGDLIDRLRLRILASDLARLTQPEWRDAVAEHLETGPALRTAGDGIEAHSQRYEDARSRLRLVPMPPSAVPPGDLAVPSLVPELVEVFALDAGSSLRFVPARLAARWSVPTADLITEADEQVRKFRLERLDRSSVGRPDVKAIFGEEPHSAAYARQLGHFAPDAIGALGTLLAIPSRDGVLFRALDPGLDLRGDLVEVAVLADTTFRNAGTPVLQLPIWRRPDGSCRVVRFRFSDHGELLGSWNAAFDGVLTALAPVAPLDIPAWGVGCSPAEYTFFAGLVSMCADVWPEEVGILGDGLGLPALLERCKATGDERWPEIIDDQIALLDLASSVGPGLLADVDAPSERVLGRLVAQMAGIEAGATGVALRATDVPGLVETLGLAAMGRVAPVPASAADRLGSAADLFSRAEAQGAEAMVIRTRSDLLSARAYQMEGPSASVGLLRLGEWQPGLVGPGGLIVASGAAGTAHAIAVDDVLAVIDLGAAVGLAAGDTTRAGESIPPTVVWLGPSGRAVVSLNMDDAGLLRGGRVEGPVRRLAQDVPMPKAPPFGLDDILGGKGWRRLLEILRDEVIVRFESDPSQLTDLRGPNIREFAVECRALRHDAWPGYVTARFDEIAVRRARLDAMTFVAPYAEVRPALMVGIGAGLGEVVRTLPDGTTLFICLFNDGRKRPLLSAMLARWGVDPETCWEDAIANLLAHPALVDEPIEEGHASWRRLQAVDGEWEAAAAFLDRRHPGTRAGFVVSITHGSRAHYVRLDDPGAVASVPRFAAYIAAIYERASAADDAHSSWLCWMRPDGRLEALFDVLEPIPGLDRLPAEFAALA